MTPPPEAPVAEATPSRVVTERHAVRRPLTRSFWVLAAVAVLALTGVVGFTQGPAVERSLVAQARQALVAEGLKGVGLVADGQRLTAEVPTGRDPEEVSRILAGVAGVAAVRTTEVFANAAEARACNGLQRKLDRATRGQRIPFTGTSTALSGEAMQRVRTVAGLLKACRAATATVGGHTDSSTHNGPEISLGRARAVIKALTRLGVDRARLAPRGYADQFPLGERGDAASQAKNHRVSVVAGGL
jgi:outer membrane protein OmpA-like peptidoglycan-associated protein